MWTGGPPWHPRCIVESEASMKTQSRTLRNPAPAAERAPAAS